MRLGDTNIHDKYPSICLRADRRGGGTVAQKEQRYHGEVSRRLFEPLFPGWPQDEIPVGYVTNGVHMPTWDSAAADDLWTEACGKDRWLGSAKNLEQDIRHISDVRLWQFRNAASQSLVEFTRKRLSRQLTASGATAEAIAEAIQHRNGVAVPQEAKLILWQR